MSHSALLAHLLLRTCNVLEPYANYWLNTQSDTCLRSDLGYWLTQPCARFLTRSLQFGHSVLQWLVYYIQTLPILSAFQWWIRFYVHLILDIATVTVRSRVELSYHAGREDNFWRKGNTKLSRQMLATLSTPPIKCVDPAYASLGTSSNADCTEAIQAATLMIRCTFPFHTTIKLHA